MEGLSDMVMNPLDRSAVDPLEDVPVVGGMQMIPITRLDSTGGEDMFLLDLFVGEHVVTAQRFRFAIRRKSSKRNPTTNGKKHRWYRHPVE